jgi:hypothetical protein
MTPLPPAMATGGCWRLPLLSLPIKGIKSSLTHARTSGPIDGLGGLRSPSSTWTSYPTMFCPRASTSSSLRPLLRWWMPLACPSRRRTFLHLHLLFPKVWSPFPLWGMIPQDSLSLRSAAPVLGGPRLGGALACFALPLRHRGRSPTRLTPLHHWAMHIAAPTLTLASTYSLGLRRTDLAVFLSTAPLAEFPLRLAMGGVPAVKTLGQLLRPRLRMDVLRISEGARSRSALHCTRTPPLFLRFSTGGI